MFEALAAVIAKIASASTIAQATAGLGVAVVGVTGAGAAGVLPGPVQDTVAGAVQAITPFDLPDSSDRRAAEHSIAPASRTADDNPAGPSDLPSAATLTAVPSATPEVEDHGAEAGDHGQEAEDHGQEAEDGTHQHRGGRTASTAPRVADSGQVSDDGASPATADDTDDDHGGDSGSSGSGGSRHGGDDG